MASLLETVSSGFCEVVSLIGNLIAILDKTKSELMDLKGRRILVTGADGFIGSHLVEELVRRGHSVRAFVFYNSFNSWGWLDHAPSDIRKSLEVFAGDIRDPHGIYEAMKGCEVVIHLAALIAIPYSYHSPNSYVDTNVKGTLNVVQAAKDMAVERVVVTSTSEVYGTAQFVPITEHHPLQSQSPYAATKIGADQIALSYHASFNTPVSIVRPFNTYGPRQSARAVIPTIITQIASGLSEVHLGSLHPTRDFSYIKDTVQGFIAIAMADACVGKVTNIGSSFEISIGDAANLIAEIMDVDIQIVVDEIRNRPEKSEVERLFASIEQAQLRASWQPEYLGLEGFRRGLQETVLWFGDPDNLAGYKPDSYNI
jgi:NAD dependent epimerase/dehydratase